MLGGPLEPTNEAYAIAKIAGIKLCQAYDREYGANSSSPPCRPIFTDRTTTSIFRRSHVLAALLRKAHEAMEPAREKTS